MDPRLQYGANAPNVNDFDEEKIYLWSYARVIKFVMYIDLFLSMFGYFVNPYQLIGVFLILFGLYGVRHYKFGYTCFYAVYCFLKFVLDCILIGYFDESVQIVFLILSGLVNLWIFELTVKFIHKLKYTSEEKVLELRAGWSPPRAPQAVYY